LTEYGGAPSPAFPHNPPPAIPQLDEAIFYLAYEYERSGAIDAALRCYRDLIREVPTSKYVMDAYLAFGEIFFREAQQEPTLWVTAKGAYAKLTSVPPPGNTAYGAAWMRLGQIAERTGETSEAIDAYRKAAEFAAAYPDLPGARALASAVPPSR
jgi:tetratricopeptide (TPR) repeat protein